MDVVMTGLRVLVALGVVLAVIWFLYKRVGKGQSRKAKKTNPVTVISKQGIGAKASVVIIDAEGQRFILGVTENNVSVLHSADAPTTAPALAAVKDFDTVLDDVENASGDELTDQPPAAVASVTPEPQSQLHGSILAGSTWRQAFAAMREGIAK